MIVFLVIIFLSILVLIHEFFHFYAAKLCGVAVKEFGFGIPPRLFSFKRKGTIYSFNLFPLGGFVRLKGEISGSGPDSFTDQPAWKRALIVAAGPVGNFVISVALFAVLFMVGNPRTERGVLIEEVLDNSPAALAGLHGKDVISKIDSIQVHTVQAVVDILNNSLGDSITLTVSGVTADFVVETTREVIVHLPSNVSSGDPVLGAVLSNTFYVSYVTHAWYKIIPEAIKESFSFLSIMFAGLVEMFRNLAVSRQIPQDVVGVVGVFSMAEFAASLGPRIFANFIAVISLNLAMFNLLPIPALDGGRLVFVGLEALLGKRIKPKIEKCVNGFGLVVLLALFVFVTVRDVGRL